eukprot:evm.model.NODE_37043_length_975_cov_13.434872.1
MGQFLQQVHPQRSLLPDLHKLQGDFFKTFRRHRYRLFLPPSSYARRQSRVRPRGQFVLLETEKEIGLGGIYHSTCSGVLAVFIGEVKTTGRVQGWRKGEGRREKEGFVEVEAPDVSVFLVGGEGDLGKGGGKRQPKRSLFCIVEEAEGAPVTALFKREVLHLVEEGKIGRKEGGKEAGREGLAEKRDISPKRRG